MSVFSSFHNSYFRETEHGLAGDRIAVIAMGGSSSAVAGYVAIENFFNSKFTEGIVPAITSIACLAVTECFRRYTQPS